MKFLRHSALFLTITTFGAMGCRKSEPPVPATSEAPVQNAFTDYVDRGKTTMDKAATAAASANQRIQQTNDQTSSIE